MASHRAPSRVSLIALLVCFITAALTTVVLYSTSSAPQAAPPTTPQPSPSPVATPSPTPVRKPVTFTIATAGDVLPHTTVNRNALQPDGSYNYVPLMEGVRPWIANADLALCSLEVPLRLPGTPVTAYPVFGAPEGLIPSLKAFGWDGCATASNHALDKRVPGLEYTLKVMDQHGLGHTGTGRTPEETVSAQFYEVTKQGVTLTVAHLSATVFHNDYTDPAQFAKHLHALDVNQINDLATKARAAGADIVLLTPHWGTEYSDKSDARQREITQKLAQAGQVDAVIGGHPHVPQPMAKVDGGPKGNGMWVVYSMGNFLSNQDEICCRQLTATGLIVTTKVEVAPDGSARVTGLTWMGSTVDTRGKQRLYPLQALVDGLRPQGITLAPDRILARHRELLKVMGPQYHDPSEPAPSEASVKVVPRR